MKRAILLKFQNALMMNSNWQASLFMRLQQVSNISLCGTFNLKVKVMFEDFC
ncbi:MAG: hypothetical protein ABI863_00415 [Ginsengibacter sp.]